MTQQMATVSQQRHEAIERALRLARIRAWARSGRARQIRIDAGLAQADIAAAVGVVTSAVSRWESGDRAPHGPEALAWLELLDALEEASRS